MHFPKAPSTSYAPSAKCAWGLARFSIRMLQPSEDKVTFPQVGELCAMTQWGHSLQIWKSGTLSPLEALMMSADQPGFHSCAFLRIEWPVNNWVISTIVLLFPLTVVFTHIYTPVSLVAQTVKNLPVMQETQVWSLGQEDPLEKEMAIHSTILAWRIPWTVQPGGQQSMGSQRVRDDWAMTSPLYTYNLILSVSPYCLCSGIVLEGRYIVPIMQCTYHFYDYLMYLQCNVSHTRLVSPQTKILFIPMMLSTELHWVQLCTCLLKARIN